MIISISEQNVQKSHFLMQKGDYGDFFDFEAENVIPFVEKVENFLKVVKGLINLQE